MGYLIEVLIKSVALGVAVYYLGLLEWNLIYRL